MNQQQQQNNPVLFFRLRTNTVLQIVYYAYRLPLVQSIKLVRRTKISPEKKENQSKAAIKNQRN